MVSKFGNLITGYHLCAGSTPTSGNALDLSQYNTGCYTIRKTPTLTYGKILCFTLLLTFDLVRGQMIRITDFLKHFACQQSFGKAIIPAPVKFGKQI